MTSTQDITDCRDNLLSHVPQSVKEQKARHSQLRWYFEIHQDELELWIIKIRHRVVDAPHGSRSRASMA